MLSGLPIHHLTTTPEPIYTPRLIGSGLESYRRELAVCGKDLRSAMPARAVSFIDEALRLLGRLTCRIAVVGQVKSGKSSFINALVKRPGLLPTDVNPWTTAITHLHFGKVDAPPGVAAEFKFFDANEWDHLANGSGYIRELTQRLVPGFEAELLKSHVDAMRRRSEERLGQTLDKLLGATHAFKEISPDILERYVCSGPLDNRVDQKGVFSDIIKHADLYFESSEFGFPTTIIDTPGTNDPFLVRDEITRRALAAADIYIVVLTARQALSSADISLIRILRGLNKERIVVFINRIDELGDVARDVPVIVQHVKAGLQREFPRSTIPIVAGSASWARTSLFGSKAEVVQELAPRRMQSYIRSLSDLAGAEPLPDPADQTHTQQAQILVTCSGLPILAHVLARLALRSHTGHALKQISRSFGEFAEVGRGTTLHELEALDNRSPSTSDQVDVTRGADLNAAPAADIERLTAVLRGILDGMKSKSDQVIEAQFETIREQLKDVIAGFAAAECDLLRQAIAAGRRRQAWQCHTAGLRQELEKRLVDCFRVAQRETWDVESRLLAQLQALLRRHYPQWQQPSGDSRQLGELPSVHALSQTVALDLGEPWWRRWWSLVIGDEDRIFEIDRLIKTEFNPLAEEMALAARDQLRALQESAMHRATAVYMGLVEAMDEQRTQHLERNARSAVEISKLDYHPRVMELQKRLAMLQLVSQRVDKLHKTWSEQVG